MKGGEYEVDFRKHPEAYRYQSGDLGVFNIQSYKDKLLPHWGFKDEETAETALAALSENPRRIGSKKTLWAWT